MKNFFDKLKSKFGWKELILCAVLAFFAVIFVIVFTGNTATVKFVSVGGNFDAGEGASIYDYGYYLDGSAEATVENYHEVLTKEYRISSVATLPEVKRKGYVFEGWFYGEVAEDGKITYGEKFEEASVKKLEKDSTVVVYAKWTIQDEAKTISKKDAILASLNIGWKGMLGIFIVITIIFICIVLLNFITKKLAERRKAKTSQTGEKEEDENKD